MPEATPGRLISGLTEERVDSTPKGRAREIEAHRVRVTVWLAGGGGRGWGQRVVVTWGMASRAVNRSWGSVSSVCQALKALR